MVLWYVIGFDVIDAERSPGVEKVDAEFIGSLGGEPEDAFVADRGCGFTGVHGMPCAVDQKLQW